MGADWYSMTCIGLKVPRKKVIAEIEEYKNLCCCDPKVDPPEDYLSGDYCSHCGKPLKKLVKINKPLFDVPEDYYNKETKIKGWKVEHDTDARNFYICIFTSGLVEDTEMSLIPDVSERTLAKFNADMREVGLWDKDQFGLWTITYCSY